MQLFAIYTGLMKPKDDLVKTILSAMSKRNVKIDNCDILAVSSKVVATVQNRLKRLDSVEPSAEAKMIARKYELDPHFAEIVLREADVVYWGVPKALLTLKNGIFTPNAGADQKNAPNGHVALWPKSPHQTAETIRKEILRLTGKRVGVLIVDSRITPLRRGTTGIAIGVTGFEPLKNHTTEKDLFSKPILITRHNLADDLASAAHLMMGESNEQTPAVLIKNAPARLQEKIDQEALVIPQEKCLFASHFQPECL